MNGREVPYLRSEPTWEGQGQGSNALTPRRQGSADPADVDMERLAYAEASASHRRSRSDDRPQQPPARGRGFGLGSRGRHSHSGSFGGGERPRGALTGAGRAPTRGAFGRGVDGGERGQGYRKLWAQVTKVGRGERLGESPPGASDMTVEDLLRIIRGLGPEMSAIKAVARGLHYLDSRALAALLKELAKAGLTARAIEIFDWLRGLEDDHELAPLCDVYTYTTIISQCGSHQQLRRALELVAEMRSTGIPCNVHTYSALMNVCIKANELDLALDVYGQLVAEGCTPNLVTYNILIDIYGKTGQWEDAVKVLDALEAQGTIPEVRTYNTIINACNRSGQPGPAVRVYERMLADGVTPTATTYTALISAYGKNGQVDDALRIFQDMVQRGCERNVITYSSLISACEKSGHWSLALELYAEMQREGCKPNVVTFNALIAACGQAGQWEQANNVFEQMRSRGCKPDTVTFVALINAFERGGQWHRALQTYETMQAQGYRPDLATYNSVIEVLWRSGVLAAQWKAIQTFQIANRQGQLRISCQGGAESAVMAFTAGAAAVAVLHWLADLRSRLTAPADSPPHLMLPLSHAPHSLNPSPRTFNPSPRDLNPSPRTFNPSPRDLNPSPRNLNPSMPQQSPRTLMGLHQHYAPSPPPLPQALGLNPSMPPPQPQVVTPREVLSAQAQQQFSGGSLQLSPLQPPQPQPCASPVSFGGALAGAERPALLMLKNKHHRAEAALEEVRKALTALLAGLEAPATVAITPQGARIETTSGEAFRAWLQGDRVHLLLLALEAAAAQKLSLEALVQEDLAVEARCREAFAAVKDFEKKHGVSYEAVMRGEDGGPRRGRLGLLRNMGRTFGFGEETIHDGAQLMDRVYAAGLQVREAAAVPMFVAALVLLSARQGERPDKFPSSEMMEQVVCQPAQAILDMEQRLSAALGGDTGAISALRILHLYLERIGCQFQEANLMLWLAGDAIAFAGEAQFVAEFLDFPPSLVAAAVLYVARREIGNAPLWPRSLADLTGHQDPNEGRFAACINIAEGLAYKAPAPPQPPKSPAQLAHSLSGAGSEASPLDLRLARMNSSMGSQFSDASAFSALSLRRLSKSHSGHSQATPELVSPALSGLSNISEAMEHAAPLHSSGSYDFSSGGPGGALTPLSAPGMSTLSRSAPPSSPARASPLMAAATHALQASEQGLNPSANPTLTRDTLSRLQRDIGAMGLAP